MSAKQRPLSYSREIQAKVLEQVEVGTNVHIMTFEAPEMAKTATPGQFVLVDCGPQHFLRRPFGVYDCDPEAGWVQIGYIVVGEGTRDLTKLQPGDTVGVTGPLGQGFKISEDKDAILVGGGTGIFPLHFLAKTLTGQSTMIAGFRSPDHCFALNALGEYSTRMILCLEAGEADVQGTAIDGLYKLLEETPGEKAVYICGPRGMMAAGSALALQYTDDVQVSLEERMVCGVGYCSTCTTMLTGGRTARVCYDGPVFDAREVAW